MKATVVEIKNKAAVLLQEDGIFIKMNAGNYQVGDVVNMSEMKTGRRDRRRLGSVAAAAAVAVLMGTGVYVYADPAYYVSVDVNPGINMEVNRFDRVIGFEAANEDAALVLEGLSLTNRNVEEALNLAVNRISEMGYFEDGGEVLISTSSEDEEVAETAAENLDEAVEEEMEEKGIEAEATSKIVGYEMVQAAKEIEGMTPGKYNIIVNLVEVDPAEAADYAETSIKDIMKLYTESKGAEGKQKAEVASERNQNENRDDDEEEKTAPVPPQEAQLKEKNAPVDTPASDRKSPNANEMRGNSEDRSENAKDAKEKNESRENGELAPAEGSAKPEIPEIPAGVDSQDSSEDQLEEESSTEEGSGNGKPEDARGGRP